MFRRQLNLLDGHSFLWKRLVAEKKLRAAIKADPSIPSTVAKMDIFEQTDFSKEFEAIKEPTPDEIYERAERQRANKAEDDDDSGAREDLFEDAVRRSRAQLRAREHGLAQRTAIDLKKSFNAQQYYVASQLGRYSVVDIVKLPTSPPPAVATPPQSNAPKGLFLG